MQKTLKCESAAVDTVARCLAGYDFYPQPLRDLVAALTVESMQAKL